MGGAESAHRVEIRGWHFGHKSYDNDFSWLCLKWWALSYDILTDLIFGIVWE